MKLNPKRVIYYERYLWDAFIVFAVFLFIYLFIQGFLISSGTVFGRSMENTYINNDKFVINKLKYLFTEPKRFNVVQVVAPGEKQLVIKRIVGMPGETVIIKRGSVFIKKDGNEEKIEEPYLNKNKMYTTVGSRQTEPKNFTLKKNEYFVIGDNRPVSKDSRSYGPVHRNRIVGYVAN